jgi:hypothetical protein
MCLRSKHGWIAPRHILRLLKHTQCSICWVQRIGGTKASIYILIGDGINRTLLLGNLGGSLEDVFARNSTPFDVAFACVYMEGGI